jgi:mono/diheme cytochrome c family protein
MELNSTRLFLLAAAAGVTFIGMHAAEPLPTPPPEGAALFKKHCAPCHGADGKAGTPMAKRLGVKDLTGSVLSAGQIADVINDGVKTPRGGMPSFKGKLTDEERQAIATFVHGLQVAPAAP